MTELRKWRARRAGGRITVYGELNGAPFKVVGVDEITSDSRGVIATDKNGAVWRLV